MGKRKIAVFLVILAFLALGVYWQLGGFNPIGFTIEDCGGLTLIGLTYKGTPQDKGMVETFQRVESLIEIAPNTHLHTLYYTEPAGKLDTLRVFVGMEYDERLERVNDLEILNMACSQVIVADIQAHRMVMPVPDKVKKELEAFAKANGVVTQGIYIDKILRKDRVQVLAPLE